MKDAKEAMDALENKVKAELHRERDATVALIKEKIEELKQRKEFLELSNSDKNRVLEPLLNEKQKASDERFIGNLRNLRNEIGDLVTRQLNYMIELATPERSEEPRSEERRVGRE